MGRPKKIGFKNQKHWVKENILASYRINTRFKYKSISKKTDLLNFNTIPKIIQNDIFYQGMEYAFIYSENILDKIIEKFNVEISQHIDKLDKSLIEAQVNNDLIRIKSLNIAKSDLPNANIRKRRIAKTTKKECDKFIALLDKLPKDRPMYFNLIRGKNRKYSDAKIIEIVEALGRRKKSYSIATNQDGMKFIYDEPKRGIKREGYEYSIGTND